MHGKSSESMEYAKERYRGKGNAKLPAKDRDPRPQPNLGRDRAEALMRKVQGRKDPVGRAGTPPRKAPGDGPARPLTIQERGGDFLFEKKGK